MTFDESFMRLSWAGERTDPGEAAPLSPTSYGNIAGAVQAMLRRARATMPRLALAATAAFALLGAGIAGARADAERPLRIVALGDSLVAGLGLRAAEAFPARLQQALAARGHRVEIIDAGVSGDTAADGLARLDWSAPDGTDAVILELGANDALRGVDPAVTRASLGAIIRRLKERRIAVLLCGMLAPRNLGAPYAQGFDALFAELARAHNVLFYPFFLDGVATNRALNQADGKHPSAAGVNVIVDRILPSVEELIAQARSLRGS